MTLKFSSVKSIADFYVQLKKQSKPPDFGDNLDALHDFLATDLKGPATVEWKSYRADVKKDGALKSVAHVLRAAGKERSDLKIVMR